MHLRTTTIVTLFCLGLIACKSWSSVNAITIEAQVSNVPNGKIYLIRTDNPWQPFDSTLCSDGHFVFRINSDTAFEPFLATLAFSEGADSTALHSFYYRDHQMGADSIRYFRNNFYVEPGYTRIEGNNDQPPYLRLFAGPQTEIMLQAQKIGFGWLHGLDSVSRLKRLASFKRIIVNQPGSYFLLQKLYDNKEQYSVGELRELIALFTNEMQHAKTAKRFEAYFTNAHKSGESYPNLLLPTVTNEKQSIFDTTAKVNVVVFWASWCVPCRKEIPALKKLYQSYKARGLHLASISLDEQKDNWLKALRDEKMPWPQHLLTYPFIDEVRQRFNVGIIPFIVFTDRAGKELKHFIGYAQGQENEYETLIRSRTANE